MNGWKKPVAMISPFIKMKLNVKKTGEFWPARG